MRFSTEHDGTTIYADFMNGRVEFSCDLMGDRFDSSEKIESAIAAYSLSLRKDFSNRTAYMVGDRWNDKAEKVMTVEVTSIEKDGKDAWIKIAGRRSKVNIQRLFESQSDVVDALDFERDKHNEIKEKWFAAKRWTPANTTKPV